MWLFSPPKFMDLEFYPRIPLKEALVQVVSTTFSTSFPVLSFQILKLGLLSPVLRILCTVPPKSWCVPPFISHLTLRYPVRGVQQGPKPTSNWGMALVTMFPKFLGTFYKMAACLWLQVVPKPIILPLDFCQETCNYLRVWITWRRTCAYLKHRLFHSLTLQVNTLWFVRPWLQKMALHSASGVCRAQCRKGLTAGPRHTATDWGWPVLIPEGANEEAFADQVSLRDVRV